MSAWVSSPGRLSQGLSVCSGKDGAPWWSPFKGSQADTQNGQAKKCRLDCASTGESVKIVELRNGRRRTVVQGLIQQQTHFKVFAEGKPHHRGTQ